MIATRESNILRERGLHINFVRADWLKRGCLLASLRSVDIVSFGELLRRIRRMSGCGAINPESGIGANVRPS